jgi:hypothetical protein
MVVGMARPARAAVAMTVVACLLCGGIAHAELGGDLASVHRDREAWGGALQTRRASRYVVYEVATPALTVAQYVSPAGKVFAVRWQGRAAPDLKRLLGAHYAVYMSALATRRGSHHVLELALPNLVVQATRYLRYGSGRAYVPALLPQGLAPEEVR